MVVWLLLEMSPSTGYRCHSTVWFCFCFILFCIALSSAHNSCCSNAPKLKWTFVGPKAKIPIKFMCTKHFRAIAIARTAMSTQHTGNSTQNVPVFFMFQHTFSVIYLINCITATIDSHLITNKTKQITKNYCPICIVSSCFGKKTMHIGMWFIFGCSFNLRLNTSIEFCMRNKKIT